MRGVSSGEVAAARRIGLKRGRFVFGVLAAVALCPAGAVAQAKTFSYTGGEQTFVVPPTAKLVELLATGGSGGGSAAGSGAVVSALLNVTPGEVLYVEVGGVGASTAAGGSGGFNGGGDSGPTSFGIFGGGGGGASDVRTVSCDSPCNPLDPGSLRSRLIVAGGGGGGGGDGTVPGGDAGFPGFGTDGSAGGGAGTQTAGGAGGCTTAGTCDGSDGSLGVGGGAVGGGGGGGLYGGGGGAGDSTAIGGGGGGSSLVPSNGSLSLAPLTTPPSIVITPLASVGGTNLPVKGTVKGTITADASTFTGMTQAAGQLSLLGAAAVSEPFRFKVTGFTGSVAQYDAAGTTTIVATNGDKLFGAVTGSGSNNVVTGDGSGTNTVVITGGTGRFAYAIGTLTESYTNSGLVGAASGQITVTVHGQISGVGAQGVTG